MTEEQKKYQKRIAALEDEVAWLKKQQIEVENAKGLYLKIFEDFPALIWRSGLDKKCDYFNKAWLEFRGRTLEQEFGNGWTEGVHPDDFDFCLNTYVTAFDKREPFLMVYRLKNKHGEYRWINDYGRPFYDLDNTFLGYIGSCYDITENKKNEIKLEELNATKDKFFSIIAHDLRGPFYNILGFAELLVKKSENYTPEKIETMAKHLYLSANNTKDLLENLLDWSSSQSDRMPFNPKAVKLNDEVGKAIKSIDALVTQKNIRIEYSIDENIVLLADENMFRTILRNLISNAIKYSEHGQTIRIAAEKNTKHVEIKVSDQGIGMDEKAREKIFDLTKKHSTAGTAGEKGTGIGLIICKEFIERHNGTIWVESKLGKGSTFRFTLPLKE